MAAAPASPLEHVQASLERLLASFDAGSEKRTDAIAALQKLCDTIGYDVVPFGSHIIGTALPSSDVDVTIRPRSTSMPSVPMTTTTAVKVINGNVNKTGLQEVPILFRALHKGSSFSRVTFVKARVPLITCRFQESVDIDIAFMTSGVETSTFLRTVLKPDTIKLVRVFKFLLQRWRLNDTHRGGIGSLVAALMVLHFFQARPALEPRPISEQLVEFLEFWIKFDHRSDSIRFCPAVGVVCRTEPKHSLPSKEELVIMHPIDKTRNAASGVNRFANDVVPRMQETLSWLSSASSTSKLPLVRAFGAIKSPTGDDVNRFERLWYTIWPGKQAPYQCEEVKAMHPRQVSWKCKIVVDGVVFAVGYGEKKLQATRAAASEINAMIEADPTLFALGRS